MDKALVRRFLRHYRGSLLTVLVASMLLNLLVFGGSLYMLLVYDSVLPSGSIPTLFSLFAMLLVVHLFQYAFDLIRSEAMLGLADDVHRRLAPPLHHAVARNRLVAGPDRGDGLQPLRDLDQIHAFLGGPGPVAIIDLPWVLLFLLVLTLLHWTLGLTALIGVLVLATISWISNSRTHDRSRDLAQIASTRQALFNAELRHAEVAAAMGMQQRLSAKGQAADQQYLERQGALARIVNRLGGAGRNFRLLLQSAVLTAGALLVIDGNATGGIIIAASILAGRALAPVDQAIANWRGLEAARSGAARIAQVLDLLPPPPAREVELPSPAGPLTVDGLYVAAPGSTRPILSNVTFRLEPGEALGVIGPSAAGKSTLARGILGIWPALRGDVRLDGATFDQWAPEILGAAVGYVPQNVELVEGTIGENIARFQPDARSEDVIAAATAAGLDQMIRHMPDGYDTRVGPDGQSLSAGQRQRIGLARALYGNPHLLVLDEANANLDQMGDAALEAAIAGVRARKGLVVMITHRPAALRAVSHLAILQNGQIRDIGPRDEVLKRNSITAAGPDAAATSGRVTVKGTAS